MARVNNPGLRRRDLPTRMADEFGAVGDGVTNDSTRIQAGIDALSAAFLSTGVPQTLAFRDGAIYVCRGLRPKPGVSYTCAGSATLLKTPFSGEAETVTKWWRIFDAAGADWNNEAACQYRITFQNLILDGNQANLGWTDNTYNQEQGHCLFLRGPDAPVNAAHRARFRVINIKCRNSVADGVSVWVNADVIAHQIEAENCFRGGLVTTGGNSKVFIRGFVGENARVDTEVDGVGYGGSLRLDLDMADVVVDRNGGGLRPGGIDFGGTHGGEMTMDSVRVYSAPMNYFASVNDPVKRVSNSYFTVGSLSASANRFVKSNVEFTNTEFRVIEQAGATAYAAIHSYPTGDIGGRLSFRRCRFSLDPAIKTNNPSMVCEVFRANASISPDAELNGGMAYEFVDCEQVGNWDTGVNIVQGGTVTWSGGVVRALTGFSVTSTSGRPAQLTLSGQINLAARVTALLNTPAHTTQTGSYVRFDNVRWSRYCPAGATLALYPVHGSYAFEVDGPPTTNLSAIRGSRCVRRPGLGASGGLGVQEWVATTSSLTASSWAVSRYQTEKGATASRPALTAVDVGVRYLDTTLAADGRPIAWNGAAWVDQTGAIV